MKKIDHRVWKREEMVKNVGRYSKYESEPIC